MSISLAFADQPEKRHSLQIVNKLSQGKFEIYHAYCESKKTDYALKLFPKNSYGAAQYQKETLMFELSHKNIIQSFPVATANHRFYTILTELASYGDVFEMVVRGFFDSEALIRTYFHQLIEGIEYMHSQGVAHLDLKLENLMIGNDFTLKIIDFDQAQKTTDKKLTSGGTKGFRAPEVIDGSCTNFTAADIYSAGIILFALKAQSVPFAEKTVQESENKTTTTLEYHKQFMTKNKTFWETKAALKNDENFYSEGFKTLVNGMLELNPEKRLTLDEIKNSEWYNGPILSQERLKAQMRFKWEISKRK